MDWRKESEPDDLGTGAIAQAILVAILLALWLNGNAIFLFVPQVAEWLLFFGLATTTLLNFLSTASAWTDVRLKSS